MVSPEDKAYIVDFVNKLEDQLKIETENVEMNIIFNLLDRAIERREVNPIRVLMAICDMLGADVSKVEFPPISSDSLTNKN